MTRHRYPVRVLRGDYVRAGVGVALTAGPLAAVGAGPWVSAVLGGLAAIFAYHGWRTWRRQGTLVEVSDTGISTSGRSRVILPWAEVSRVRLRYYSTRRDRTGGWMQLILDGPGGRLRIESTIDDFDVIARRAAAAAAANGLVLDDASRANFAALRLDPAGDGGAAGLAEDGPR